MARLGFKFLTGTEVMHLQSAPHFLSDCMQGYGITHNMQHLANLQEERDIGNGCNMPKLPAYLACFLGSPHVRYSLYLHWHPYC